MFEALVYSLRKATRPDNLYGPSFRYTGRHEKHWMPPIDIGVYTQFFGKDRFVLMFGWGKHSLMLQRYGIGVELETHTDGPSTCPSVLYVLKNARRGGIFRLNGEPVIGRRRIKFDGGKDRHGFSCVEEGTRWTLIFQRNDDPKSKQ